MRQLFNKKSEYTSPRKTKKVMNWRIPPKNIQIQKKQFGTV